MALSQAQRDHLDDAIALKLDGSAPTSWELLQKALTLPTPDTVTPPGPRKTSIDYWLSLNLNTSQRNAVYELMFLF